MSNTWNGLKFTKMHGLGNDYVYVNALEGAPINPPALSKLVSDRHTGIGADGLVLILPSDKADFRMQMFNADGSEAQMCGNAIRCVGKYLYDRGITKSLNLEIETKAGIKILQLKVDSSKVSSVTVDMGEPELRPAYIPLSAEGDNFISQAIPNIPRVLNGTGVSMGNPHCVIFVDQLDDELVHKIGPIIENHPLFPERVNVEFVRVISKDLVEMRVWERGSGETQACGTGACAVTVAAALNNLTNRSLRVKLLGGDLLIDWRADGHVMMTGPAVSVFDGILGE